MNGFVRQIYGRSGSKINGVLVSCPPIVPVDSIWLRLVMTTLWVLIAVAFCRFTLPSPVERETVVDTSRIADIEKLRELATQKRQQPPPEEEFAQKPEVKEPEPPPAAEEKSIDPLETPRPEEVKPLTIARPSPNQSLEPPAPVRTNRDRIMSAAESPNAPSARIIRDAPSRTLLDESRSERRVRDSAVPMSATENRVAIRQEASRTAFAETRGERKVRDFAVPLSSTEERVSIKQQNANAKTLMKEGPTARRPMARQQVGVEAASSSPAARIERGKVAVASTDIPRSTVKNRDRDQTPTVGVSTGVSEASRGKVRGVSFQSLDVCPTIRDEEEGIRKLLAVVGSRTSCGEFRFTGMERISSFNMLIDAPKGRRLSNRCEELDNAFNCLKKNR